MTSSITESLTHREDVQMRSAYPSTRLTVADLEQVQVQFPNYYLVGKFPLQNYGRSNLSKIA